MMRSYPPGTKGSKPSTPHAGFTDCILPVRKDNGLIYFFVGGSPEADWYEVLSINIDEIHCCNSMAARDSSQKPFPTTAMLSIQHPHSLCTYLQTN